MASAKPRPRWFFLITPSWLAWHAFAVFAAWGMLWLGDWQFHRAEGGNALSWAYTFEWPIFTIFGVVFWAKTIYDEFHKPEPGADGATPSRADGRSPAAAAAEDGDLPLSVSGAAGLRAAAPDDDPELAAYNAYLARLNSRRANR